MIEQLDEVVREQWAAIEALRREVRLLRETIEAEDEDGPAERPPPHY